MNRIIPPSYYLNRFAIIIDWPEIYSNQIAGLILPHITNTNFVGEAANGSCAISEQEDFSGYKLLLDVRLCCYEGHVRV